MSVLIEF